MSGDRDISNSLIYAVRDGNLERVRELIDSFGLCYSEAWSEGYVLLCDAIVYKHTKVAELLLTNGSKVNSRNTRRTDTPLHYAVINGDIELVEMLLNRGVNINVENWCGNTPLHNAVKSKKIEHIEFLLKNGAYVNARNSDTVTPLHLAVEKGSKEIVKLLLKHGAHVDSACDFIFWEGCTPQLLGVEETSTSWEGYTPLWLAAKKGHEEVVKLLLECGANINAQDKYGRSLLHFVVEEGQKKVVQLLLEYRPNVNTQDKNGKTALHFAVERRQKEFVHLLLECGANVDAQDKDGKTALHFAVERICSVTVGHVLKHCPDVNNKSNRSALNVAVQGNGRESGKIVKKNCFSMVLLSVLKM